MIWFNLRFYDYIGCYVGEKYFVVVWGYWVNYLEIYLENKGDDFCNFGGEKVRFGVILRLD